MAKEPIKTELVKMVKKLNRLKLSNQIATDDFEDVRELAEVFVSAVEDIDNRKESHKLTEVIAAYHNNLVDWLMETKHDIQTKKTDKGEKNMDFDKIRDELEDMEYKEAKKFVKEKNLDMDLIKGKKSEWEDDNEDIVDDIMEALEELDSGNEEESDEDEFDEDELRDKLEGMEYKEVKAFVKENNLDVKVKKKIWEDDEDEVIDSIVEAMKKAPAPTEPDDPDHDPDEVDEEEKDTGDTSTTTDRELPKGWRSGSPNTNMFNLIVEKGEVSVMDLAIVLNGGKKKDADKHANKVVMTLARKFGSVAPVVVTFAGEDVKDGIVKFRD